MSDTPDPFQPPRASLEVPVALVEPGAMRTQIEYLDAYQSCFKSPKWGLNLLFMGICLLIPIAGVIVNQGYYAVMIARRHQRGEVTPPEFDFKYFGTWIERGVWPFLASLIAGLVLVPVVLGIGGALVFGVVAAKDAAPAAMVLLGLLATAIFGILFTTLLLVLRPILLRATFHQSLTDVFSLSFVGDFVKRMWLEMILVQLFLGVTAVPLIMLGYLMCGLGLYPASALISHASAQLDLQLYEVYLSRGGSAIRIEPRLLA